MSNRYKRFGPRLTVSLKDADYKRLNDLAAQDDVSVSWVVRRAIEDYLRKQPRTVGGATAAMAETLERRTAHTL